MSPACVGHTGLGPGCNTRESSDLCVMPRNLGFYPKGSEEPVNVLKQRDRCDHVFI